MSRLDIQLINSLHRIHDLNQRSRTQTSQFFSVRFCELAKSTISLLELSAGYIFIKKLNFHLAFRLPVFIFCNSEKEYTDCRLCVQTCRSSQLCKILLSIKFTLLRCLSVIAVGGWKNASFQRSPFSEIASCKYKPYSTPF